MDDDTPLAILNQLIRIPSQNPMGHDQRGPEWCEQGMSDWLCRFFASHNIPHRYDQIESGRGNVIAKLDGDPDRPTILLDAHQDTVPVAGMTIDPYRGVERDGRIYGRGACDVKGPMAAILSTVARLHREEARSHASLVLSMTCDEELGQKGAIDLARRFGTGDSFLTPTPDLAIVAEPTELNVVVAHKGVLRWRIRTTGVAAHSSRPRLGQNAIYSMARTVRGLEQLADELQTSGPGHPLCGRPTLSVGTIRGGESVNIVPQTCVIEIDRRVVPGESFESILDQTRQALERQSGIALEMLPPDTVCDPLRDGGNEALAESLVSLTRQVAGVSEAIGVAFTTQAPKFAAAGLPTVVFGPGSIDQAHTKDEWIDIEQLNQGAEILFRFAKQP
ncbi:Acetylornithine deacetylase [Stieleria neptunia]|uniref:Acetylornithine deacetylase n=1 Tax=Stieleria neptunia TaxID=2527979 RepID=A0A518HK46_9BACT|nr:M20 family metallopeptidase [Stieleria neptunia]QDV41227.1 Acetylornithine deacetylase [Stieleria neptunia]